MKVWQPEIFQGNLNKKNYFEGWYFKIVDASEKHAFAIIIVSDDSLSGEGKLLDIGAAMQSICLVAWKYGLGTCIARQGVFYPDVLRRIAGIPESKRIVIAIPIGYPDWDFPANKVETDRERAADITTWVGFE